MQLNYVLLPRLEGNALQKVVVMLWNKIDILAEISFPISYNTLTMCLEKWVERIKELSVLVLPKMLLNKATPLFKPIGSEIIKWIYFHAQFLRHIHKYSKKDTFSDLELRLDRNILRNFSWTSVGTINYQKTAQELIRLEILDNFVLYKLACLYCMEDCIPVIWGKLPVKIKLKICDEENLFQTADLHVKKFWSEIILDDRFGLFVDGDIHENVTKFYQHAFKISSYTRNKAATEYFYQKLNTQKEFYLMETAKLVAKRDNSCLCCLTPYDLPIEKYSDVFCYLLSQMIPGQQLELFKSRPGKILSFFLVWPWQDLFLDVAELMWDFLPEVEYHRLLKDLHKTNSISECVKEHLFREFFQRSPENFKKYFIDQERGNGNFLLDLFTTEKSELIRCIFRNIGSIAKLKLMHCHQGQQICFHLVRAEKWHLLKLFIEETKLSKENTLRLKGYLKPYLYECNVEERLRCKIQAFEQLFDVSAETNKCSLKRTWEDEKK